MGIRDSAIGRPAAAGLRAAATFLALGLAPGVAPGQALPEAPARAEGVPEPPPLPAPLGDRFELPVREASRIEVKVGQGRFLTFRKDLAAEGKATAFLAVGDPAVLDFYQVGPRQLRLIGKSMGTTDLAVTDADGETHNFEVRVVADLDALRETLGRSFPDASLTVSQFQKKVVVEGQARDAAQVNRIIWMAETFINAAQESRLVGDVGDTEERIQGETPEEAAIPSIHGEPAPRPQNQAIPGGTGGGLPASAGGASSGAQAKYVLDQVVTNRVQVVNLIRVPTSQQVLLKVRVAELNRTGFRQIGADLLGVIPEFGTLLGTQIAGNGFSGGPIGGSALNAPGLNLGSAATAYGTFSHGQFNAILTALRRNNLVKILAEPNLVALNGHQANFLAGGEFPVPSFSGVGAGAPGGGGASTTQFKEFGVRLAFMPIVLDRETIRLTVDPEVSSIDFSLQTTLVPGGSPVPGLNTRKSHTTVELRQGETLAIAGLMQLDLAGNTQRIPGLGDLPYIGPFFSNTTSNRVEKELIVLVTPYIVEPMAPGQVPPVPGDEVAQPNDLEFFLLNRIEGRTGVDARSTTTYDDPFHLVRRSLLERKHLIGPSGFSD